MIVEAFEPQLIASKWRARSYAFVDFPNLPRLLASTDFKGITERPRIPCKDRCTASRNYVDRGAA
jgi:hypothetical protein